MDLDEFKQVNDTLGHQHGDALLKLVTERLVGVPARRGHGGATRRGRVRRSCRPGAPTSPGAATVVWKIQQALEPPFVIDGHDVDVKASIGITLVPDHGDNIDDLLRRADLAMYDAKRSGTGYALFAAEQEETPARRLALLGDLRRCIERDELVLHYQPKIDLATQETIGVEALMRWNHPSGRLFMPADFMPEVERSELMIPMTEWVINEALRQLRSWRDEGYDLTMAVNIGARCLAEGTALFETVDELTSQLGHPAGQAHARADRERADRHRRARACSSSSQSMDERLSIDDFGTGYSSLVYLQRLPVVEIKADSSFVMTMCTVKDDAVIVRSIIDLAHNLGVKVVAEGVEDEATMDLLIEYGCDEAQGYHFSRPVPGEELLQLARDVAVRIAARLLEVWPRPRSRVRAPMASGGHSEEIQKPGLRRELRFFEAIALSLAIMAPTAAMALNGTAVAGLIGRAVPLAFLIATIGVLFVSYGFVRLTRHFNSAGSVFALAGATLGPRAGFFAGFALMATYTLFTIASAAEVGLFGQTFLDGLGAGSVDWLIIALVAMVFVAFLAFGDIRVATRSCWASRGSRC